MGIFGQLKATPNTSVRDKHFVCVCVWRKWILWNWTLRDTSFCTSFLNSSIHLWWRTKFDTPRALQMHTALCCMFSFAGKGTIKFFIILSIITSKPWRLYTRKDNVYVTEQKLHCWNPYCGSSDINKSYFTIMRTLRYETNGYIMN